MKTASNCIAMLLSAGIFCMIFSDTLAARNPKAPKTIVEFYNFLNPGSLQSRNAKWYAEGIVGEEIEVDVDIGNGYLKWTDPGTGGGMKTIEAALFITNDNRSILAVSRSDFDGVIDTCDLKFHEYKNGMMEEIKSGIVPALPLALFQSEQCDRKGLETYRPHAERARLKYELPRYGTVITVSVSLTGACSGLRSGDLVDAEKEKVMKLLEGCYSDSIELNWDLNKGIFTIGKTSAGKK